MNPIILLEWWNLIYIVPLALALMYLGLFVLTGITFGDADIDADLDADGSVHVEAHVLDGDSVADSLNAEIDGDIDHDIDHDLDHNADHALTHTAPAGDGPAAHTHFGADFLSFLGVGKIPLSLALMALLLFWGTIGFATNAVLVRALGPVARVVLISLPVTLLLSVALTGACAALIAKLVPVADSRGQRRRDLVGRTGDAILDIDATFGMASVRNAAGDLFQVPCKTADGTVRIPKGARVILFNYDSDKGVFHVAPFAL